jgi:inosine-uridine nucleoside N-ribohydrolase
VTDLLIDTDPGIDDALALLLAWGWPGARVEALTTVAGNVPLDCATTNALRLIELRRPAPAPAVVPGAAQPLTRSLTTATRYHGEDGLGDLGDWPPQAPPAASTTATEVIVETTRRLGADLTLVALGPLTNVALAVAADPAAMAGLGRLVAMGGAVDVKGNVTPSAEFNMHVDPEAAARVLAAGLSIDLVPLDATHQATVSRRELETALARHPGPVATRIAAFTQRAFRLDGAVMALHDPLAVAVALDPGLVTWERVRLTIGSDGATRRAPGPPNCRVATGVERARFIATFLDRLCPASAARPAS